MYRTRTTNVSAAQWSPNGGTLGALDLTEPSNQVFGDNVFGAGGPAPAAAEDRLPAHCRTRCPAASRWTRRSPTRSPRR